MKTVTLYTDGACEAEKEKRRWRFSGRVEMSAKRHIAGAEQEQ